MIKNAGKHSEEKSYSVQVLVGISAVCLSIAISPLLSSVFWGIPFLMFFSVWSWLVKSEKNVACRKYIYITTASGSVSRA